jgi:hypothetical protein
LNDEFSGLLESGRIERTTALPEEEDEVAHLPRLRLHFNRRAAGRLRGLIDRLNVMADEAAPPVDARGRAIFATPLPRAQAEEELEDND